jgi:lipopolysaccharide transport protein LptA
MIATKSVTLRQVDPDSGSERYATGERAEYDSATRMVTLTGNPRAWEGKNLMTGERMDFSLENRNVVVKGKVGVTVYPAAAPEAPKSP